MNAWLSFVPFPATVVLLLQGLVSPSNVLWWTENTLSGEVSALSVVPKTQLK